MNGSWNDTEHLSGSTVHLVAPLPNNLGIPACSTAQGCRHGNPRQWHLTGYLSQQLIPCTAVRCCRIWSVKNRSWILNKHTTWYCYIKTILKLLKQKKNLRSLFQSLPKWHNGWWVLQILQVTEGGRSNGLAATDGLEVFGIAAVTTKVKGFGKNGTKKTCSKWKNEQKWWLSRFPTPRLEAPKNAGKNVSSCFLKTSKDCIAGCHENSGGEKKIQ